MTSAPHTPGAVGGDVVQGRKIVVCVAGGIAAYKVVQVVRDLALLGADVRVAMTRSAAQFVGEQTLASLSGHRVYTELFSGGADVPHVELARGADLAVVAPATADLMARMAAGMAGDLVAATLLTVQCPVLLAPAMHTEMWENPATQHNVELLVERGVELVGPASGALSSGDEGVGRMVEPSEIVEAALTLLARGHDLAGKRLLITAGGTQEPIDPVRFIGNRSSGLMGYTIAAEALRRGAKVTLVAGPSVLPDPPGVELIRVRTAQDMRDAVVAVAPDVDVIVKAAAVADFRIADPAGKKLKKAEGPPEVHLEPTPDILSELGHHPEFKREDALLVGFAAETEPDATRLGELAQLKRDAKKADLIVANDVGSPDSGFEVHTNRAVIAGPDGIADVGLVTKKELARALVDKIASLIS